ncbi:MAG: hypothetical protein WC198_07115, partial [Victivallaceae bacterium]
LPSTIKVANFSLSILLHNYEVITKNTISKLNNISNYLKKTIFTVDLKQDYTNMSQLQNGILKLKLENPEKRCKVISL